ncbi:MAG: hypothetical protein DRP47_11850 [Candidatus Zixiibacteriota bacterium]|nr:MAG: hypothetical protein DRP47_11850 [candidate division Zixibacteria bacterium]
MSFEHIKITGPHCLRASVSMPGGLSQKEFDEDTQLGGKYLIGGQSIPDVLPLMLSLGLCPGAIASFATDPFEADEPESKRFVGVDKFVFGNISVLASRAGKSVDSYIDELLRVHLVESGVDPREFDYAEDNGLEGGAVSTEKIKGWTLKIPIEQPAIVMVNTTKGASAAHAVYWDGKSLYDSNCEHPKSGFDGYSIAEWIPIMKIDIPLEGLIEDMKRRAMKKTFDNAGLRELSLSEVNGDV